MPMTPRQYLRLRKLRRTLNQVVRAMAPTLIAFSLASVAHAQGTISFSGAQTFMQTVQTSSGLLNGFHTHNTNVFNDSELALPTLPRRKASNPSSVCAVSLDITVALPTCQF
jgi:hypothetical protein